MIEEVLNCVKSQPQADIPSLLLEEVAVCSAWYASCADSPESQARYASVPSVIEEWVACRRPPSSQTLGRRQQLLLRQILDVLLAKGAAALAPDQVELLCTAYQLNRRSEGPERLGEVIAPYAAELAARRHQFPASRGVILLEGMMQVVTADVFASAPRKRLELFPGDPAPVGGPTVTLAGPVRVLGSVPENATLVVEQGGCSVSGYVLGRVLSEQQCDVRENIAGAVLTHYGDIRCRNIIDRARVIAKWGSVHFASGMSPEVVFAGHEIEATGDLIRGTYLAPRIEIEGEVEGGTIQTSQSLFGGRFKSAGAVPLRIVFRRELTCEDYGERMGMEANKAVAKAARLRRRQERLTHMIRTTQEEAEHAASSALLHLFSGELLVQLLDKRNAISRRLAVLNRVITALYELCLGAEEHLGAGGRPAEAVGDGDVLVEEALSDLDGDWAELSEGGFVDDGLRERHEEMMNAWKRMGASSGDHKLMSSALIEMRERLDEWIGERQRLTAQMRKLNEEIRAVTGEEDPTTFGASDKPRLVILRRKLLGLKQNPSNAQVARQLESSFVHLMTSEMERRIGRMASLGTQLKKCRHELAEVNDLLRRKYGIVQEQSAQDEGTSDEIRPQVSVTGRFDVGVQIFHEAYLLDSKEPPEGTVMVTPNTGDDTVTYVRGVGRILQLGEREG